MSSNVNAGVTVASPAKTNTRFELAPPRAPRGSAGPPLLRLPCVEVDFSKLRLRPSDGSETFYPIPPFGLEGAYKY